MKSFRVCTYRTLIAAHYPEQVLQRSVGQNCKEQCAWRQNTTLHDLHLNKPEYFLARSMPAFHRLAVELVKSANQLPNWLCDDLIWLLWTTNELKAKVQQQQEFITIQNTAAVNDMNYTHSLNGKTVLPAWHCINSVHLLLLKVAYATYSNSGASVMQCEHFDSERE